MHCPLVQIEDQTSSSSRWSPLAHESSSLLNGAVNPQPRPPLDQKQPQEASVHLNHIWMQLTGTHVNAQTRTLLRDVTLLVDGESGGVAISGPSGCGKSTIVRLIAKVWEPSGGTVRVAGRSSVFVLPQTSYFTCGTLREQITYPSPVKNTAAEKDRVVELIELVRLGHLLEQCGLDTVRGAF